MLQVGVWRKVHTRIFTSKSKLLIARLDEKMSILDPNDFGCCWGKLSQSLVDLDVILEE
jgi:hypothetical protein